MGNMFGEATGFHADISKWDVSRVSSMNAMFLSASVFNSDISKWDVSSVTNMASMFHNAYSFRQKLCGHAWVHSTAIKDHMFSGSSGLISQTACTITTKLVARRYVTRRTAPMERDLMAGRIMVTNMMNCPQCGTFKRSGRVSCCAPGGAWYKNCGGAENRNVGHSWVEGAAACTRKIKGNCMHI